MQHRDESQIPRPPTQEELNQLLEALAKEYGPNPEDNQFCVDTAYIAVFDHYTTFYPGFWGKVMMVIWGTLPGSYEVYTWGTDGKLLPERQEGLLQEKSFQRSSG